jgi:hypothetical protein
MIQTRSREVRRSTRLPNFLVIGAMKAGTTSLYHYLAQHPQIFMPRIKELDFFAVEGNWPRGLDWYRRQFADAVSGAIAVGEASTVYTKYPRYLGVPGRIAEHLPQARLIYLVRDPLARMRSHYAHRVAVGAERQPIDHALLNNPVYLDYSRYALQIEQYLPYFPPDRLLVLASEDLRNDRRRTIQQVFEFLGVDGGYVPPTLDREFYVSEGRPVFSPALWNLRRSVRRYFPAAKRAKEWVDSIGGVRPRRAARPRHRGAEDRAHISDRVRQVLEDELRPDVERLRTYLPAHFDGWEVG